jgi:hypothetical protein
MSYLKSDPSLSFGLVRSALLSAKLRTLTSLHPLPGVGARARCSGCLPHMYVMYQSMYWLHYAIPSVQWRRGYRRVDHLEMRTRRDYSPVRTSSHDLFPIYSRRSPAYDVRKGNERDRRPCLSVYLSVRCHAVPIISTGARPRVPHGNLERSESAPSVSPVISQSRH